MSPRRSIVLLKVCLNKTVMMTPINQLLALRYSGVSFSSSSTNLAFVYNWGFDFTSNSPFGDCTIDNSCDLTVASFDVSTVAVAPGES